MSEVVREIVELKREVVESRNQAIKTDNQVKNLSLDVKGFEKRFDLLEKRTRLASVGAYVVVALTVAIASYLASSVQISRLQGQVESAQAQGKQAQEEAQRRMDEATAKLAALDQEKSQKLKAQVVLTQILDHLDKAREREAITLLEKLDSDGLDPLVSRLGEMQLMPLRVKAADAAYKSARSAISANRADEAIRELQRYRAFDRDGRYAGPVRYLLAVQLWQKKRYEEMIPLLDELKDKETDKGVLDEARYFRAAALAHLGRNDEAKTLFASIVRTGTRHASPSRAYLDAMTAGSELPDTR